MSQVPKKASNIRKVNSHEHRPRLGVEHNHGTFNYPHGNTNVDCHQCNWGRNQAPFTDLLLQLMNVLLQSMHPSLS